MTVQELLHFSDYCNFQLNNATGNFTANRENNIYTYRMGAL